MLACWLTYVYFNIDSNNVNKKMTKNELFLVIPLLSIGDVSTHHSLKAPPFVAVPSFYRKRDGLW